MTDNSTQTEQDNRISEDCEKLLRTTENELYMYKNDKVKLKQEVLKILQENQAVHSKINNLKKLEEKVGNSKAIEKHEQLTNDAILKLKGQISILREERDTIQTLWKTSQDTISNLEKEIYSYRNQIFQPNAIIEIKTKYTNTIDLLESTIKNIRKELDKQITQNRELLKGKNYVEAKLRSSEDKLFEQEKQISKAKTIEVDLTSVKDQLKTTVKSNQSLEKSLRIAKRMINERFFREKLALEKVQEALLIAENAIAEKEDALNREIVIREECDSLAKTIGHVMEEAALKVEKDVYKLRKSYENKIEKFEEDQNKLYMLLEDQKKLNQRADFRCQSLEKKIKEVLQENVALETDIQVASQAIVELELKIAAMESLMNQDKQFNNRVFDERETQIEDFLIKNQHIKEKWKKAIEDITIKFEIELEHLQDENAILKVQNEELKIKLYQLN